MTADGRFIGLVREGLAPLADAERAAGQAKYLKTDEPMLGARVPDVRKVVFAAAAERFGGDASTDDVADTARALWGGARNREERRAAIMLLQAPATEDAVTRGGGAIAELVREFVTGGAWWDLVDDAVHVEKRLRAGDPAGSAARMRAWARDGDMWVRRYAILHQLRAAAATDTGLLADVIAPNIGDGEFFIRKAIGWALRDYAKTDADWVRGYLRDHPGLSPLSRREAAKHL